MFESPSYVIKRTQCPRCLDTGKNNLCHFSDGHSYCFSCSMTIGGLRKHHISVSSEQLPMYTTYDILKKRGIREEVIKSYGVTTEQLESGEIRICFPLHDINGDCYGKHYRAVDTSTGTLTRKFYYEKGTRLKLPLFGWQLVTKHTHTILVTEGETDALAAASSLFGHTGIAVVGIVGTANAERVSAALLSHSGSRRLVLALDNDAAGIEASKTIVEYLERHESDVKLHKLAFPRQYKDISDWLASEKNIDLFTAVNDAMPVSASGLLNASEIADSLSEYIDKLKTSSLVEFQFSPTLSKAMRLLPGKLVGICGSSGTGKSTLAEHITLEALTQKFKVFVISQEMSPPEFCLKCLRMIRNEPLDDPHYLRQLTSETLADIEAQVKNLMSLLHMTDSFGVMSIEKIDKHLHTLKSIGYKPDVVIVDHLLAIANSTESANIMDICRDMKELARNHDTCMLLLSHVRKSQSNKKGVYRPQLDDIYGSSGLQIYADCIVAVASDKQKKETYVEVIKVERLGGFYADVHLLYSDYLLSEVDEYVTNKSNYDTDEEYEEVY